MRPTAVPLPLLAAPFFAAALLTAVAPVAAADPVVDVSPGGVGPGGSVTVSVACDDVGTNAPESLDAVSQAFAEGSVRLDRIPAADDGDQSGPAYRGTARIAAEADLGALPSAADSGSAWTVDGTCPAPAGGEGREWSAALDVGGGGGVPVSDGAGAGTGRPCAEPRQGYGTSCAPGHDPTPVGPAVTVAPVAPVASVAPDAPVDRGVRAGDGGSYSDSVPALVAGGLLIAGAFGATAHRLWRRRPATDA